MLYEVQLVVPNVCFRSYLTGLDHEAGARTRTAGDRHQNERTNTQRDGQSHSASLKWYRAPGAACQASTPPPGSRVGVPTNKE
jgi:hypothetical protein